MSLERKNIQPNNSFSIFLEKPWNLKNPEKHRNQCQFSEIRETRRKHIPIWKFQKMPQGRENIERHSFLDFPLKSCAPLFATEACQIGRLSAIDNGSQLSLSSYCQATFSTAIGSAAGAAAAAAGRCPSGSNAGDAFNECWCLRFAMFPIALTCFEPTVLR